MDNDAAELDRLQQAYLTAAEAWIGAIRAEAQLASVNHTVAEVDLWENAHFRAEAAGGTAEHAKAAYEAALRSRFFGIA